MLVAKHQAHALHTSCRIGVSSEIKRLCLCEFLAMRCYASNQLIDHSRR